MANVEHYEMAGEHFAGLKGHERYAANAEYFREIGLEKAASDYAAAALYGSPERILGQIEEIRDVLGDFELSAARRSAACRTTRPGEPGAVRPGGAAQGPVDAPRAGAACSPRSAEWTGPARGGADPGLATAFRETMAAVCTPVAVMTGLDGELPHGTTVSAFASLSMNPPMVLVALDRASELLALVRRTRRFGLNLLGAGQAGLARRFAAKGGAAKFAGVAWERHCRGAPHPRLGGLRRVHRRRSGARRRPPHRARQRGRRRDHRRPPLVYHRRAFGTPAALPEDLRLSAPGRG